MRKKRILIIIISFLFIIVSGFISVYFSYLHHYKGKEVINEWNETDVFQIDSIKTIEKEEGKDFVILNLTDIQLCDIEDFFKRDKIHKELTYLVNETKPDLITLTGDQTWSNENLMSLKCIIRWLDSYKIPYAPVFGNHDFGNEYDSAVASSNYCSELYENGKYSLFDRGPTNLESIGNYVINIMENGKIYKTLYMLDSGYNDISDEQLKWFKWNADEIKSYNDNQYSEGMIFTHKPIPEYSDAYYAYYNNDENVKVINEMYDYCSLSGISNRNVYKIAKECGVKDFVCGHQHANNFTLEYYGVRLTFALKTGELSFYYDDSKVNLNGATVFTLRDKETIISNIYVDRDEYHFKDSENIYNEYYN